MNALKTVDPAQLRLPRAIALDGFSIALCLAIVVVSLHALYPATGDVFRFLGYVLLFNLLPGLVFCRLLFPKITELGVYFAFSLGVGIVVNTLVVTILWPFGQLALLFMLPLVAVAILLIDLIRTSWKECICWMPGMNRRDWIVGTLFFCAIALIGIAGLHVTADPESYSAHSAFEAGIIRGIEVGWPPANFVFPNSPWSYNYAVHLWLHGVNFTVGIPIDALVVAYGPALLAISSALLMAAFGRFSAGLSWWTSCLAVLCVYGEIGISPVSGAIFANFMPFSADLILSPYLSFIVFFLTVAFVLGEADVSVIGRVWRVLILIILGFLATGARGVCTPILLCALALRLVISIWKRTPARFSNAIDIVATTIGFAAGMAFFFTVGHGFSGAGTVKINGQPFLYLANLTDVLTLAPFLVRMGMAVVPAGIIGFAVIALFQAAFLTPALPAFFIRLQKCARDVDIVVLGSGIAGLSGFFLTEAPELSHISFLNFSDISFSILGGLGLEILITRPAAESYRKRWIKEGSYIAIVLLGCLQLAQIPPRAVAWVGEHLMVSIKGIATGIPAVLPNFSACMKEDDANLLARVSESSPTAVVIPIYLTTNCAALWWVVRHPVHTLNPYMMQHVPGRATNPILQAKIETQRQHMFHAMESAAKGFLDVPDVVAMAKTLRDQGPVFVIAPSNLSIETNDNLRLLATSAAYKLYQVTQYN